jgi:L-malate glycosyltransferase
MKIGVVCYPTYGGSGAAATDLAIALAKRGHEMHLISYDRPFRLGMAPFQDNLFFHQINTMQYPVLKSELYTLSSSVRMAQLIQECDLDILHSHYAVPHAVSAVLAREMCPDSHVRLVTTLHGTDITLVGSNPAFAPVVRMGIARSDAVISVSQWLADQTKKEFGLCKPCNIIYNFVDPEEYQPRPRGGCCGKGLFAQTDEKIIMHISNFRPVKRVCDAVRAFASVIEKTPAVLLMIGDGPDHDKAQKLARELGVDKKVKFLGLQNDVAGLLSIADLFLFPSEYESFGLAVLEAMMTAVPVVCSNGGGLNEVMKNGETGYLCNVGDTEDMARRTVEILTNPELGRKLGTEAREHAIKNFRPELSLEAHEALYEKLLNDNSIGPEAIRS